MKFGEMIKAHRPGLVVSPHHDLWMKNNGNPNYSSEAIKFGTAQLRAQAVPRDRSGTYSASSLNSCRRRQQFTFLGMPELPPTARTAAIFQNGTFMHIRYQMAGLTEGWMLAAEVPVGNNDQGLSGTQDGIAYEGSVVELKSTNSHGFNRVMSFGALEGHAFQVGTYVLTTGAKQGVLLYENKDTQDYKEIVLERADLPLDEIEVIAEQLWKKTAGKELADMLPECRVKTGYKYAGCPFRKDCPVVKEWDQAESLANASA